MLTMGPPPRVKNGVDAFGLERFRGQMTPDTTFASRVFSFSVSSAVVDEANGTPADAVPGRHSC